MSEAPKVSPQQIQALMTLLEFQVGRHGESTSTFAHVFLGSYYLATGHSACISPANFNAEQGNKIALEHAFTAAENKLWELEGYALKKELDAGYNLLTPAQQALPEHEVRVFIEHNQLMVKAEKLQAFLATDTAMALPDEEKDLLLEQLDHMTRYGLALANRINLFGLRAKAAIPAPQ